MSSSRPMIDNRATAGSDPGARGRAELEQLVDRLERRVAELEGGPSREHRTQRTVRVTSQKQIWGLPLYSIAFGPDAQAGEVRGHARGILAIGDLATGVLAIGGIARGVFAIGGLSCGLFGIGGCTFGLIAALGGVAAGGFAMGGVALGIMAWGGVPLGLMEAAK